MGSATVWPSWRSMKEGAVVADRDYPVAFPVQDQQRSGNSNRDAKRLFHATANIFNKPYFLL
jgi:hypothetical protein